MSAAQARTALMTSGAPPRTPQPNWCGLIAHSISDHRLSHFHERFPLSVFPCLFSLDRPPFLSHPSFPFLPFSHLFSPFLDEHGTPGVVTHAHLFQDTRLSPGRGWSTVRGIRPCHRQTYLSLYLSLFSVPCLCLCFFLYDDRLLKTNNHTSATEALPTYTQRSLQLTGPDRRTDTPTPLHAIRTASSRQLQHRGRHDPSRSTCQNGTPSKAPPLLRASPHQLCLSASSSPSPTWVTKAWVSRDHRPPHFERQDHQVGSTAGPQQVQDRFSPS